MCVGIPARIEECDEISAIVDLTGTRREISMMMLDGEAKPGDWVLVHAGYAVTLLDPDEAQETLRLMVEMANHAD
ncbi:MAG: HypC/HybG/HupF family hydrogenase formation chaperone [Deferribacteraceae bacterium]|jgi:hydrogenase expression/formation protein HypC|nr:HypC/HybG/HupF family hydrogenase formation chaperone [Deferribacteraceae bacterium]